MITPIKNSETAPAAPDSLTRSQQKTLDFAEGYIWADNLENAYSAANRLHKVTLVGVPRNASEIRFDGITIRGLEPFKSGVKPTDTHTTATLYHDSFAQTSVYMGLVQLRKVFEELGPMSWKKLIANKSGRTDIVVIVNDIPEDKQKRENADYTRNTEVLRLSSARGLYDMATDWDLLFHEMGHYIFDHLRPGFYASAYADAMNEAYGDALAAYYFGDPEICEDFGAIKESAKDGAGLRNVANTYSLNETGSKSHDVGQVYGGFLWSIAEYLHQLYTGKPRDPKRDQERLDPRARGQALKILFHFPLFITSNGPTRQDLYRTYVRTVDSLVKDNKLDPALDILAFKNFLRQEALRRGIIDKSSRS